jgi:crotonobetainyl-CoA:carnitine CoA-transferase CaiB-like acyl-CoA transferase
MRSASIPCGEVRTVSQAMRSEEARARGLVTRIEHPELGWLPNVNLPIRYSATPLADPVAAPTVGQQTGEILRSVLSYSEAQIASLLADGVVGGVIAQPVPA